MRRDAFVEADVTYLTSLFLGETSADAKCKGRVSIRLVGGTDVA